MQLVSPDDYTLASHLFQPLDFHLAVSSALQGCSPAQLFTDRPAQPASAALRVQHTIFLAGAPDQPGFNEELRRLFRDTLFPAFPRDGFMITWADPGWERALREVIMGGYPPIFTPRQYYALDLRQPEALPASLPALPEGLSLQAVDPGLAANSAFTNLDDLREELLSERPTIEAFLENSFGTCIVSADKIVTWCLSEYNLGARCEVGIATHPDYRGRGLATLTGLAFLLQAWDAGIRHVGWQCLKRNTASGKTALKIGLRKERDYPAYLVLTNRTEHLSVHGEISLYTGDYAGAAGWFERAFALGEAPGWAYLNAARTYSRLAQPDTAFRYLALALEKGCEGLASLEEDEHLASLRGTDRWKEILAQSRKSS